MNRLGSVVFAVVLFAARKYVMQTVTQLFCSVNLRGKEDKQTALYIIMTAGKQSYRSVQLRDKYCVQISTVKGQVLCADQYS